MEISGDESTVLSEQIGGGGDGGTIAAAESARNETGSVGGVSGV